MTTITCPNCQAEHGVFWLVQKNGRRVLSYRCNKVSHFGKESKELHSIQKVLPVPLALVGKLGKGSPEEWSKGWAKQMDKQQQAELL